mmetsp:Transcript_506/g.3661  ORF Transcript_506/g.3661 Transcript_506/m.3661 type:complete len:214 (+) Transcript_506:1263-1904(+)
MFFFRFNSLTPRSSNESISLSSCSMFFTILQPLPSGPSIYIPALSPNKGGKQKKVAKFLSFPSAESRTALADSFLSNASSSFCRTLSTSAFAASACLCAAASARYCSLRLRRKSLLSFRIFCFSSSTLLRCAKSAFLSLPSPSYSCSASLKGKASSASFSSISLELEGAERLGSPKISQACVARQYDSGSSTATLKWISRSRTLFSISPVAGE